MTCAICGIDLADAHPLKDAGCCTRPSCMAATVTILKRGIDVRDAVLTKHNEAGALFQPGGKYHHVAKLALGELAVVDGMKWLDAERERLLRVIESARPPRIV